MFHVNGRKDLVNKREIKAKKSLVVAQEQFINATIKLC